MIVKVLLGILKTFLLLQIKKNNFVVTSDFDVRFLFYNVTEVICSLRPDFNFFQVLLADPADVVKTNFCLSRVIYHLLYFPLRKYNDIVKNNVYGPLMAAQRHEIFAMYLELNEVNALTLRPAKNYNASFLPVEII